MKEGKTFKVINPHSFKEGSIVKCVRYVSEGTSYFDVVEGESHYGKDTDIADSFWNLELIEEKEMKCKDKGWKEGHVFKVVTDTSGDDDGSQNDIFDLGSIIVLIEDDGSQSPKFALAQGGCQYSDNEGFYNLDFVKRIYPPEKNTVTIEIEGQKTEISLESAKALKKVLGGI